MKKEYMYRGKPSNDLENWVEGDLITMPQGKFEIRIPYTGKRVEVYPDTVCELSGFTDRNGKPLYDGDLVLNKYDMIYLFLYNKVECCWCLMHKEEYLLGLDDIELMKLNLLGKVMINSRFDEMKFELIGNIFDNVDMIK